MEHPVLAAIHRSAFTPLGWFAVAADDPVPEFARFVILIGNAGPAMFNRFAKEHCRGPDPMDAWTRKAVDALAEDVGAKAAYPFDKPPLPFLTWARRAGAGFTSPLGLNIHPRFGLWHAYRAALLFPVVFDLPVSASPASPCLSCAGRPCLRACPVQAFDGSTYNVQACAEHLRTEAGAVCMSGGCKARLACPVGKEYEYAPIQKQFHMNAFLAARTKN